jgi:MSHA pilin protein MshD
MCTRRLHRGVTLIELIVFIVIVSVALVGVLTVLNFAASRSADPMVRKQMLAIAEALMDEVQSQPYTWCDPDDRSATTATSATFDGSELFPTACWDAVEVLGVETVGGNTDTRLSATSPFDNVSDYNGLTTTTGITGTSMPTGYSAQVTVAQAALDTVPLADGLLISVTVCHAAACPSAGADSLLLEAYRTRHSPNSLP